jgi:hypothetical protein
MPMMTPARCWRGRQHNAGKDASSMLAGMLKAKLPCIAKANKAVQSVQAVGISAPTNADENNYARYGDKAADNKKRARQQCHVLQHVASGIVIEQTPARGMTPVQQRQRPHHDKVKDTSAMLMATRRRQGQQCQHNKSDDVIAMPVTTSAGCWQ